MKKFLTSIVSAITLTAFCLNDLQLFPVHYNANAESYRTSYTLFGDLNNDKSIDSFDVILMRSKVMETEYDKLYDFNCDDKVDSDDLTLLSDYVLGKNCIFDAYLCDDADEDYVCDLIEVAYLKSNPDSKDSDGDTLTDFEEVVYTNTSPIDKYTRKLSVTDADDDSDEDKLTNKEELALQTSPLLTDSDEDGIDDYVEINKYNTIPNDDDSDDDHIIDGDEIKLGLKPDSDKSNGSTYDYERIFDNKIPASSELLSYINSEGSPYEVSIDIKSAGNVDKALSVHIGDFSNISEDERVIGRSVSFSYDEKLSVDSAKIFFKPYDINESIENYMLFQFFPETNYLLPVETKYTKDSAYVETSELGTFCLVDTKDLIDSKVPAPKAAPNSVQILGDDIKVGSNDMIWDYSLDKTEVLFYIDLSNCATATLEATKQSILDFSEALFEHCDDSTINIIGYDYLSTVSDSRIQDFIQLKNINSVYDALEKIVTDTKLNNNDFDGAINYLYNYKINSIFTDECPNKYLFLTSDSDLSLTQNFTGYWYNGIPKDTKEILDGMDNKGIHVNTLFSINLLDIGKAEKGIQNYKDACDEYGFEVNLKSLTGYFGNTTYAQLYSDTITDLHSNNTMYSCSVSPVIIPSSIERNAFIHSLPASYDTSKVPAADSNGNIPFKESAVKVGAATLDKNGNLVFKNLYNACDESDLTRKGYEQLMKDTKKSQKLVLDSSSITPFNYRTLLLPDRDGDGYIDVVDPRPTISDITVTELKSNYIEVDYSNVTGKFEQGWENHLKIGQPDSKVSYGGRQRWFQYVSEVDNATYIRNKGCGLLAISDVLLYLSRKSNKYDTIWTSDITKTNPIPFDEYKKYVLDFNSCYVQFAPAIDMDVYFLWEKVGHIESPNINNIDIGIGSILNNYFKDNGISLKAKWGLAKNSLYSEGHWFEVGTRERRIRDMIEKDIPAIISVGPYFCGDIKGVHVYDIRNRNDSDIHIRKEYEEHKDNNKEKLIAGHYFTVTAVIEDKIKEENNEYDAVMYQISSWGEKYYVSELEIGKYVSNKTTFTSPIISVSSNVLYLEESK